jgi:hypothetical protein
MDPIHLGESVGQNPRKTIGKDRQHPEAGETLSEFVAGVPHRDQECAA